MICNECETVAHCLKNGCVPKQPSKDEALKLALEALELHGKQYPHMVKGYCLDAITAIKQALSDATHLADSALDRMAENARELGLDYESAPVPLTDEQRTDKDRLDWLNNNFFNRENVDWLTGNVSKESLMWVFFAPTKVQGDIRRVIDAAIDRDNGITKGQP
jgi:hypothetical protein